MRPAVPRSPPAADLRRARRGKIATLFHVVTRKVCGGNRSRRCAETQQILASVLQTAHQRQLDPHAVVVSLLHARTPTVPVQLRNPAQ